MSLRVIPTLSDLSRSLDGNPSLEYYAFPDIMFAFANEDGASLLKASIGGTNLFIKKHHAVANILKVEGSLTPAVYDTLLTILRNTNTKYLKIMSIPTKPSLPLNYSSKSYYFINVPWGTRLSSSTRKKIRYVKRLFTNTEATATDVDLLRQLLSIWQHEKALIEAKKRPNTHWDFTHLKQSLVPIGHYLRMITAHPNSPNSKLWILHKDGANIGFFGGYFYPATGVAVITQAKHNYRHRYAAEALWYYAITNMLDLGATQIVCGDTSGILKRKFEAYRKTSYSTAKTKLICPNQNNNNLLNW